MLTDLKIKRLPVPKQGQSVIDEWIECKLAERDSSL